MDASPKAAGAAASAQHTAAAAGSKEQQQQAKQQQQQQGPASSSQQDGSQLPASLVQQSGGSGGSLKRPRSSGGREDNPAVVVAGREVVGRQVAVWSAKLNDWPKAAIAQFSPTTQKHLVRYLERKPGEVKHHEEWVALARLRFQWLTDPPPGAAPNPTSACAPRGEDAVHWRVKVFWPGMARWYVGKVTSYDPKTKKHSVRYRDGDTQELQLRHEAVQYLEREAAQQPKQQRPPAPDARKSAEKATEKRKPAAAAGGGGGAAAGGLKKAAGGAGGTRAAGTKRQRDGSAAAGEGEVSSGGRGRAAASERKSKVARGGGAAGAARGQGVGGTPVAAPATASPPKDAAAGSRDVSAAMMTGDSEEGQVDSEGGMAGSDYGLPSSSGMTSEEEEEEEEDLGSEVVLSGLDEEEDEEEEDSDFEVESVRGRRRANNKAAGSATPRSSGRRGGAAPRSGGAGARKDRRSGGAGGSARRRSDPVRSTPGGPRLARRDSARPSATAFRKVLRADEESIKAAGAGIVGARVSVFWHEDERYYKGKLVQFDGYHKRHKIVYDDGEEEWVSLPREAFRWLTPRARSAGCTPDFRHLMQQLGAEECGPPGGGVATRRQAQAGGASPGPVDGGGGRLTGEACVGWQVSLLFDGDGQRYRGEVVGWDGRRGRALVLYDDGEDEWVDLEGEELTWHCQLAGHSGVYPGLARGTAPAGTDALGWRVGVYWAADQAFYSGEVVGYDAATGRHEVAYDDGEEGPLVLGADRVKWILPPGAAVDRERLETAAEARGRRRGGDESDPDYEAFEFRPRASQPQMPTRRPFHRSISGGLSPGPTPLAGSGQPWDLAAGAEAALANSGLAPQPQQYLSLPFLRPLMGQGVETAALPLPQHLGRPLVVRQMARVPGLADSGAPGLALPQPITVRVYMSGAANSGGSAASADTQLAAPEQAGAGGRAAGAAVQPRLQGAAKLKARLRAVEAMARRAARAQQTIVKGVPTPLPSRQQMEEAGRAAARSGLTSPTAAQRLGSSHASGLHRLARGSAVNYSPFHHKRPHPADSEPDSSSGSSEEEEEEEEEEMDDDEEEGEEGGDNGADSAERRRGRHRFGGAAGQPSDMPLSPRSVMLNGAKIKPVADGEGEGGVGPESSCMSDGMLTSAPMLGQQSPAAILSPFKQLGIPPAHMPAGTVGEAGMDGGLAGGGLSGLLPVPASLGVEGVLAAMPHSASLGGGMDTLMLQLPLPILPRGDSAHSLAHLLPLSRTASGMLAGTTSELLGLDDGGTSGGLLGPAMSLDALQPEADADRQEAAP